MLENSYLELPSIKTVNDILLGKKAEISSSLIDFSRNLVNECCNFQSKDRPSFKVNLENLEKNNFNFFQLNKVEVKNVKIYLLIKKPNLVLIYLHFNNMIILILNLSINIIIFINFYPLFISISM